MGQRYVPLETAVTGPNELQVTAPADPFVAPPGHYMLFIRSQAGVPAEAPIILLVVT
jgi:galactose oxidase